METIRPAKRPHPVTSRDAAFNIYLNSCTINRKLFEKWRAREDSNLNRTVWQKEFFIDINRLGTTGLHFVYR